MKFLAAYFSGVFVGIHLAHSGLGYSDVAKSLVYLSAGFLLGAGLWALYSAWRIWRGDWRGDS